MVQWLRLHISSAGDVSSIPGQGTRIPHAGPCGGKKGISFFTGKIVIHKYFNFSLVGPHGKEQKASFTTLSSQNLLL